MNTMNNLVQGMHIGDKATAAFIELSKNKTIGVGLFEYTSNNSFRRENTKHNFPRTSSYYNIQRKLEGTSTPFKRLLNGNLVSAYNVDGLDVGWAYTTDVNDTKFSRGYASSADFEELQKLLRDVTFENIDYKKFSINRYKDIPDNGIGSFRKNFGQEYYDETHLNTTKLLLKDSSKFDSYLLSGYTKYQPIEIENVEFGKTKQYPSTERKLIGNNSWDFISKIKLDKYNVNRNNNKKYESFYTKSDAASGTTNNIRLESWHDKSRLTINPVVEEYTPRKGDYYKPEGEVPELLIANSNFLADIGDNLYEKNVNGPASLKSFLYSGITKDGLKEYYSNKFYDIIPDKNDKKYHTPLSWYGGKSAVTSYYVVDDNIEFNGTTFEGEFEPNLSTYIYTLDKYQNTFYQENGVKTFGKSEVAEGESITMKNITNESTIIGKTNKFFKEGKINSLINRFHTSGTTDMQLSRGRNLRATKSEIINGYDNPYCRVWTSHHQYSKIKHLIRPFGGEDGRLSKLHEKLGKDLRPNNAHERLANNSVLQDNGFVRITPQTKIDGKNENIKNYMFSIENLAWRDTMGVLSEEQKGPNNGRIMWFPPYNLKFTENVNVNWNGNNFIGRGEQIYTYVNTERSGTLDFTILIDHPSILNEWRNSFGNSEGLDKVERKKEILRFFAGCEMLNLEKKNGEEDKCVVDCDPTPQSGSTETKPITKTEKFAYVIFFPNNYSGYDKKNIMDVMSQVGRYERLEDIGKNVYFEEHYGPDSSYENQNLQEHNKQNKTEFGFNDGGQDKVFTPDILLSLLGVNSISSDEYKLSFYNELNDINSQNTGDKIFGFDKTLSKLSRVEYYGFASSHGYKNSNEELARRRKNTIKKYIETACNFVTPDIPFTEHTGIIEVNNYDGREDVNSFDAKLARAAIVVFNIEREIDNIPVNETSGGTSVNGEILDTDSTTKQETTQIYSASTSVMNENSSAYDNEYRYFKEIEKEDYMVKNIVNKVRYFDPAYHSLTPEGFNARLTFLHQCTRQGPTNAVNGGSVNSSSNDYLKYAGNLSFGRAPYCILRIGDFFHTKICIDSISISYDNGGGPQWDLNPEGAGVQPMFANISMNFKFIGGQDLSGPIERLQNAITSNYYANASAYDRNAHIN